MNIVSPSILTANFANLESEINKVKNAQWLHIDIMDGHFVPNISIGMPVLKSVSKITNQVLDVHLMITNPLEYVEAFEEAGADLICFHIESSSNIDETIKKIREVGCKVGIALKPRTSATEVLPYIEKVDMVLIMTVEPGFGGQSFMDMSAKIAEIKTYCKPMGKSNMFIQVDGGINEKTAQICVNAGANTLVAGSYVFGGDDAKKRVDILKNINIDV